MMLGLNFQLRRLTYLSVIIAKHVLRGTTAAFSRAHPSHVSEARMSTHHLRCGHTSENGGLLVTLGSLFVYMSCLGAA